MRYETATSKAEASARMYLLGGRPVEPLGPGSKEKKSALVALASALGMDLSDVSGKTECGRLIAARLDAAWDDGCWSRGDTITTRGMNTLVDAAVAHLLRERDGLDPHALANVVQGARTAVRNHSTKGAPVPVTRSELEQNVAGWLAVLTSPGPVPAGVSEASRTVLADEIRFEDGSWRGVVADVQGWLQLPSEIGGDDAEAFDAALAAALGEPAEDEDALLRLLGPRLERAVALRETFLQVVEGADEGRATLATATQEWIDAWLEVEDEEEAEAGGPINAKADVWPINEFVQRAADRELELSPSYQRADVWPTGDAQMLIESVLRGIPLPSIILLQHDDGLRYEVVDGKQRLTSILRFMGFHPRAVQTVTAKSEEWGEPRLLETFQRDYPTFKKLWKQHEQQRLTTQLERDLYFPYPMRSGDVKPLSGRLEAVRGRYYSEIREVVIDVAGRQQRVRAIFEAVTNYKVPVILYEEVSSEQIHEVFSLYNKQGKHLNAEEIRNALFHHLPLMRGLLVTAGDADNVEIVAPYLLPEWTDLSSTPATLDRYGFGRAGYKRTKLLSWVASVLFAEEGSVGRRSTAGTVNALLRRVDEKANKDPLRDEATVLDAMLLLDHGLDAHASVSDEAWAPAFRNAQLKSGWQELQLVSTLIALCSAQAVLGEQLSEHLEEAAEEIYEASAVRWKRPAKTQTAVQWRYSALVVSELLALLEVDPSAAEKALLERFGNSGLTSLLALTS